MSSPSRRRRGAAHDGGRGAPRAETGTPSGRRGRRTLGRRIADFFGLLGPGLITGAADDDPSGIATYSIAGAALGTSLLWSALLTCPLMAAVQMACARVGMVTGEGLGAALKKKMPRSILAAASVALLLANTINIAADLAGMADAAALLLPVRRSIYVVLFAVTITWATIRLRYEQISRVLKWLAIALFAYVVTAFRVVPNWPGSAEGCRPAEPAPREGRLEHARRDPRHDDQPLPVFLAGVARGGGGEGGGTRPRRATARDPAAGHRAALV
jgi:hypothetical protein